MTKNLHVTNIYFVENRAKTTDAVSCYFYFRFVSFLLNVPVNNFSVMFGWSHRFLGIPSTFRKVNVSCSRTQHGDLSEDRTPDLSLRSPTLYH